MHEPDPTPQPTPEPIEPDIGVNGWALVWALIGLIVFFYHWGDALVFVAHFFLHGTPYALVEARGTSPDPLRDEDVVVVRRHERHLAPGQILWIAYGGGDSRLVKLFFVGPDTARAETLVDLDSATVQIARAAGVVAVSEEEVVVGITGGAGGDTLAELLPRDRVLGRAVQVILPLHRIRALP